jgi:catechol 2,3-dioxygenase-like lactoylglutathione lyase family enzyme
MSAPPVVAGAHIRFARPTNDLAALRRFYCEGLGMRVLFEFVDVDGSHRGFDGVMLGHSDHAYHLEFTSKKGHDAGRAPSKENLLVFYLPDQAKWQAAVDRMVAVGFEPVKPFNVYWVPLGKTFEDPDGYRIVLQKAEWVNSEKSS